MALMKTRLLLHRFKSEQSIRSLRTFVAVAAILFVLTSTMFGIIDDPPTPGGTVITNRADATYQDQDGGRYSTQSPIVYVTVATVPAISVGPDETVPSGVV